MVSSLRQLKTFIAIAETGTFSAAGAVIGLSHSAVSLHVKALEGELGVQLIDRGRRPPVLTDRGHALLDCARRMVDLLDEMAALGAESGLIGSISAGVVPSATQATKCSASTFNASTVSSLGAHMSPVRYPTSGS